MPFGTAVSGSPVVIKDVVDDKFRVNKTENEVKAALIREWIGDKGTQYLNKYKWTREEWQNHEMIMERL